MSTSNDLSSHPTKQQQGQIINYTFAEQHVSQLHKNCLQTICQGIKKDHETQSWYGAVKWLQLKKLLNIYTHTHTGKINVENIMSLLVSKRGPVDLYNIYKPPITT